MQISVLSGKKLTFIIIIASSNRDNRTIVNMVINMGSAIIREAVDRKMNRVIRISGGGLKSNSGEVVKILIQEAPIATNVLNNTREMWRICSGEEKLKILRNRLAEIGKDTPMNRTMKIRKTEELTRRLRTGKPSRRMNK